MNVVPLAIEQWDARLKDILSDMKGQPINVHKLMAHHPELLLAWWNFRNHSVTGGALGTRLGELVILRVAIHMRAWYEWGSHVDRSLACGLSLADIERVKSGPADEGWSPQEKAVLQAVDELIENHAISAQTQKFLGQTCSVQQVFDVIAIQGMYVILGGMINSFGLDLDDVVEKRLPAGINQQAFEAEYPRD